MSALKNNSQLQFNSPENQKNIFTLLMARNAVSILPQRLAPDYDYEGITNKINEEVRSKLLQDKLKTHLQIFNFCHLPFANGFIF